MLHSMPPFLLAFLIVIETIHCELHPVLLFPGLGGSQIVSKYVERPKMWPCHSFNKSFLTWIDLKFFTPFTIDCIINLLKLEYDASTHSTFPPRNCETSIPGFGKLDNIAYLSNYKNRWTSYYNNIINELVKNNNYTANVNLRGAPYDFRKSPNELKPHFLRVKHLIEEMYETGNQKSVVVIGHSYGNLLLLRLLNNLSQTWKTKYIRTFISISAPYSGSVMAAQSVLSGFKSATFLVSALKLRKMESTWPSLYYMMPYPGLWPEKPIVLTKKFNFTVQNISEMIKLSNVPFAYEHYNDVTNYTERRDAPNVEVHCIISYDVPTTGVLDYRSGKFPDSTPKRIKEDGDGTVSLHSLMICPQWKTKQAQRVTFYKIRKVKHFDMVKNEFTLKTVHKILCQINGNC